MARRPVLSLFLVIFVVAELRARNAVIVQSSANILSAGALAHFFLSERRKEQKTHSKSPLTGKGSSAPSYLENTATLDIY